MKNPHMILVPLFGLFLILMVSDAWGGVIIEDAFSPCRGAKELLVKEIVNPHHTILSPAYSFASRP